ncbi:hypothetical protein KRE40_02080 [Elizabethkingia meningoseptica]|uniref:hypothetical protein n=1 Tax=Elizabethkingia meningoseptica TaxID=238 RepID=UPI0015864CF8|nr:hypothetical protein [Elizabethkingia meningoseptica]MDE5430985.1 hypothetical protein [Elizabethkingia meningoseptica]MDE5437466.1 hypothetical protein [Elizabethkingia meningoseptica]MDE5451009.1 hypothetical protein [Elizabethkingia meningoseptica]MDE5467857.1 hypothetical protein [Elizabethkingia meningoseptica]MDE5471249.1 hypothetical protein [Elizabethkingia meningoseptica]
MTQTTKKDYTAPNLELVLVKMEESVAAGSANIIPTDLNQQAYEQWETNPEETRPVNW